MAQNMMGSIRYASKDEQSKRTRRPPKFCSPFMQSRGPLLPKKDCDKRSPSLDSISQNEKYPRFDTVPSRRLLHHHRWLFLHPKTACICTKYAAERPPDYDSHRPLPFAANKNNHYFAPLGSPQTRQPRVLPCSRMNNNNPPLLTQLL